jgi:type I restriction enzyme R subunit
MSILIINNSLSKNSNNIDCFENAQKEFVILYNKILRLRNILVSFDDFANQELLTPAQIQDYQSTYLAIHDVLVGRNKGDEVSIVKDLEFEIELVKQVEINVDYILMKVAELVKSKGFENKVIEAEIERTIASSPTLRSKKDLIMQFIQSINNNSSIEKDWKVFISEKKDTELQSLIQEENLNTEATRDYLSKSLAEGELKVTGGHLSFRCYPQRICSVQITLELSRKQLL